MSMIYRRLEENEIIRRGDEEDRCVNPWREAPIWEPAGNIGEPAPDPQFSAHRRYRRPIGVALETHAKLRLAAVEIIEAMAAADVNEGLGDRTDIENQALARLKEVLASEGESSD